MLIQNSQGNEARKDFLGRIKKNKTFSCGVRGGVLNLNN